MDKASETSLSREEVERLCFLHLVGQDGCPVVELAGRLGLSRGLNAAACRAAEMLVGGGWLETHNDTYLLSVKGQRYLLDRLQELGVKATLG
jgi:hypothetical protein